MIKEVQYRNNFSYILNDNSLFLPTEYKILQNLEDNFFIKVMKMKFNGKIQFLYLVEGYKSLDQIIENIDAEEFAVILSNLLVTIMSIRQNGFMSCLGINLSIDKIFVDPSTYNVLFIYLPISKRFYTDEIQCEKNLQIMLKQILIDKPSISSAKVEKMTMDMFSGVSTKVEKKLKLIAIGAPINMEIKVNKDNYLIGKKEAIVDGVISFNPMISRLHCKIEKNRELFLLTDMNSANGTYVNSQRLMSGKSYQLKDGDIVRLANSDFKVVIS